VAGIAGAQSQAPGVQPPAAPVPPSSSAESGGQAVVDDAALAELKKRALAYWEARVRKDYRAEYELMEPRARARVSADEYGRGRNIEYLAAQVEGAERLGNFARVSIRVLVRIVAPVPFRVAPRTESSSFQDHWVMIQGTWYRSTDADSRNAIPWPAAAN
jgi:hypothetical protein